MPVSIEVSGFSNNGGTTAASGAHYISGIQTVNSGAIIYVFMGCNDFSGGGTHGPPAVVDSLSQLTFNSRITQVGSAASATSGVWAWSFYAVASAPYGPGNIYAMFGNSGIKAAVWVVSVAGANTGSPFDPNGAVPMTVASSGGRVRSGAISTTNSGDMLLGFVYADRSGSAGKAASGFTTLTGPTGELSGVSLGMEYQTVPATLTSKSVSFVSGSNGSIWILMSDAIAQATAAASPSAVYFPLQPLVIDGGLW